MSSPRRRDDDGSPSSSSSSSAGAGGSVVEGSESGAGGPRRFGDYLLLERFARGGMGEVWLARLLGSLAGVDKFCVVKTIRSHLTMDRELQARFMDEARTVVQLTHRNICQVYEVGAVGNQYFLAMELVQGYDFRALFDAAEAQGAGLDEPVALHLLGEVLEALDYAHRLTNRTTGEPLHLVHRDVSLQNALVNLEGEVKLIDFGLAQSTLKSERTQPGIVLGKRGYMSPEQARGDKIDARADQFAAAVVGYELLTAERYYGSASAEEIWRVAGRGTYRPARLASLPEPVRAVLEKALAPDPAHRHASCAAMRKALRAAQAARGTFASAEDVRALLLRVFPDMHEVHRARLVRALATGRSAPVVPVEPSTRIARSPGSSSSSSSSSDELVHHSAPHANAAEVHEVHEVHEGQEGHDGRDDADDEVGADLANGPKTIVSADAAGSGDGTGGGSSDTPSGGTVEGAAAPGTPTPPSAAPVSSSTGHADLDAMEREAGLAAPSSKTKGKGKARYAPATVTVPHIFAPGTDPTDEQAPADHDTTEESARRGAGSSAPTFLRAQSVMEAGDVDGERTSNVAGAPVPVTSLGSKAGATDPRRFPVAADGVDGGRSSSSSSSSSDERTGERDAPAPAPAAAAPSASSSSAAAVDLAAAPTKIHTQVPQYDRPSQRGIATQIIEPRQRPPEATTILVSRLPTARFVQPGRRLPLAIGAFVVVAVLAAVVVSGLGGGDKQALPTTASTTTSTTTGAASAQPAPATTGSTSTAAASTPTTTTTATASAPPNPPSTATAQATATESEPEGTATTAPATTSARVSAAAKKRAEREAREARKRAAAAEAKSGTAAAAAATAPPTTPATTTPAPPPTTPPEKGERPPLPASPPAYLHDLIKTLEASCVERVPCASQIRGKWREANASDDVGEIKNVRSAAEQCFEQCKRAK